MNEHDEERMKKFLRQALPPVNSDAVPERNLWPAMLRQLDNPGAMPASSSWAWLSGAWFDGALLAGLLALTVCFPAAIPVLLYYL